MPSQTAAELEHRSLDDLQLKAFLEANLGRDLSPWPLERWDFHELSLAAFYFHPSLDVVRAQWRTAQAAEQTARGRPNPTIGVTPGYSFNPPSGVLPWFPSVTFDVPIETAGKRGFRIAQASHLSQAARWNIASAAWQVRSNLRSALLDFAAAERRAALLKRQSEAQQQVVTLLEQRLKAGAVASTELTPARLALLKSGTDLADAERQAAEARSRIAETIGLPADALKQTFFSTESLVEAELPSELASSDARRQALLGRPDILSSLSEYAASQSALQLEIAKQYPDVHLGTGYQFDQGEHKWSLGLSMELPVLNRNQGPIAEARARREEAAARFTALQAKVIAEIDRALAAHTAALSQLKRQQEFSQVAHGQVAAIEAAFRAGGADRLELANAQLEASAGEVALLESQIRVWQSAGQIEDALQHPLEPWPSLEQGRNEKKEAK